MKPALILYCQHSLGMGHLVRSLAVAEALAVDFDVHFLNGGRWPAALALPACASSTCRRWAWPRMPRC
ncbi:MAG: hypothetical protein IPM70_12305 [Proteobacteria bacterium]|nr:hypothetical protein [Pseudomonadota bacterium]